MKKEMGKWFLDVAKYLTTAVVLSSAFNNIDSWIMYVCAIISILAMLFIGLFLISDKPFRLPRRNRNTSNNTENS